MNFTMKSRVMPNKTNMNMIESVISKPKLGSSYISGISDPVGIISHKPEC